MAASFQPPPEAVTTIVARQDQWPATLSAIGTVAAVRGVTVSADLPGIVEAIAFESGRPVAGGRRCWCASTRKQERAQLAAAEAQRDLAQAQPRPRARARSAQGVIAQSELDRASAEHKQAEAQVGEIRATIERKQIRAPFSGVLGIRQVNLGQYLNGGDPVVPLQAVDPVYVDFSRARSRTSGQLRVGAEVQRGVGRAGGRRRGPHHRHRLRRGRGHAQRPGAGDAGQPGRPAAPGHVREGGGRAGHQRAWSRCPPPRSATRPTATPCSWSATSTGPRGKELQRREAAVREAGRRARRPGRGALRPEAGRGGRDLRRLQAAQRAPPCACTTRPSPRTRPRPSRKTTEANP